MVVLVILVNGEDLRRGASYGAQTGGPLVRAGGKPPDGGQGHAPPMFARRVAPADVRARVHGPHRAECVRPGVRAGVRTSVKTRCDNSCEFRVNLLGCISVRQKIHAKSTPAFTPDPALGFHTSFPAGFHDNFHASFMLLSFLPKVRADNDAGPPPRLRSWPPAEWDSDTDGAILCGHACWCALVSPETCCMCGPAILHRFGRHALMDSPRCQGAELRGPGRLLAAQAPGRLRERLQLLIRRHIVRGVVVLVAPCGHPLPVEVLRLVAPGSGKANGVGIAIQGDLEPCRLVQAIATTPLLRLRGPRYALPCISRLRPLPDEPLAPEQFCPE